MPYPGASIFTIVLLLAILAVLSGIAYCTLRAWRGIYWLQVRRVGDQVRQELSDFRQHQEARSYLSHLLGWDASQLPPCGGWAASADSLVMLAEAILARKPNVVVEFGSGVSSMVIGRCLELNGQGHLISYDHDPGFADVTRQRIARHGLPVEVCTVPLVSSERLGYPGKWYVTENLPSSIDILVVDGPPGSIHPQTRGAAAPAIFPRLGSGALVLLDDAGRPGERKILERWRTEFPDIHFTVVATDHGTAIGTKF